MLFEPVVFEESDAYPLAVLPDPDVFDWSAFAPYAVFNVCPPAPFPIVNPLTVKS